MVEKYYDIISETELFKGIEKEIVEGMLKCFKAKICRFNKNDYIVNSGDSFETIGIVLNGEAAVSVENACGNRIVITFLRPRDIFGELIIFSGQQIWPVSVQAQTQSEILLLSKENIVAGCTSLCSGHSKLIKNLLHFMSKRALVLNKKIEYLTIRSIRGKVSTYLLDQYKINGDKNIILTLNRNELADFLHISRPSMSREICKMRDQGIIDFHLRTFRILDIEKLKIASAM